MRKKVNKVLIRRAREQARNTARKVILNYAGSSRKKFDDEIIHILLQHEKVKEDNHNKTKRIEELERKIKDSEFILSRTANFFRKKTLNPEPEAEINEKESAINLIKNRRGGAIGAKALKIDPEQFQKFLPNEIKPNPLDFYFGKLYFQVINNNIESYINFKLFRFIIIFYSQILSHYKLKNLKLNIQYLHLQL